MAATKTGLEDDRQPFDASPLADSEERQAIFAVLDSFRQYRKNSHFNTTHRRRQNLYALPQHQWSVLAAPPFNLLDTLSAVDDAIDHNADIADAILALGLQTFGLDINPAKDPEMNWHGAARPVDMSKAHSTIRQFYRDWSLEGFQAEVEPVLKIILTDLKKFGRLFSSGDQRRVLVPGAGLGRILFELCLRGYAVEGNEISYHQLLASNFVLNHTERAGQYRLYPFASTFTNQRSRSGQLREVRVPDVHPGTIITQLSQQPNGNDVVMGEMNMTAGDFITSYSSPQMSDTFDAVLTVYFIDTAPNLMRYIETIKHCLNDDGLWINVGPLLWHYDDRAHGDNEPDRGSGSYPPHRSDRAEDNGVGEPGSFELTDEEVLALVHQMGFEVIVHENLAGNYGGYIQDPESMIQHQYHCSHWVARKLPTGAS